MKQPGIYYGLPMQEYLDEPAYSAGAFRRLRECPETFKLWWDGTIVDVQTEAQRFGSLGHARVLENRIEYVEEPTTYPVEVGAGSFINKPWTYSATYCKQWRAEQSEAILSAADSLDMDAIVGVIQNDPRAAKLLARGRPEVSMFFEYAGLPMKVRFDWFCLAGYGLDLKIVNDAGLDAFSRQVASYRWHSQAGLYWKAAAILGQPIESFFLIAAERPDRKSNAPARCNVRQLKASALEQGLKEIDRDIATLKECLATGVWPGLSGPGDEIHEMDIPRWAYDHEELDLMVAGQKVTL